MSDSFPGGLDEILDRVEDLVDDLVQIVEDPVGDTVGDIFNRLEDLLGGVLPGGLDIFNDASAPPGEASSPEAPLPTAPSPNDFFDNLFGSENSPFFDPDSSG